MKKLLLTILLFAALTPSSYAQFPGMPDTSLKGADKLWKENAGIWDVETKITTHKTKFPISYGKLVTATANGSNISFIFENQKEIRVVAYIVDAEGLKPYSIDIFPKE